MRRLILAAACSTALFGLAALPALAAPAPPTAAAPYLMMAGEGDVFEVSSSQIALMKSQNPQVRGLAQMLIDHHTRTSTMALSAAKADGVAPPPAVLTPPKQAMIDQLMAAPAGSFDRVYLQQQMTAHQEALALHQGYAARGDKPALRKTAGGAVPIVQGHLEQVRMLMARPG